MPVMLRPNKKATSIAYNLIGVPANLQARHKSRRQSRFDIKVRSITTKFVKGAI